MKKEFELLARGSAFYVQGPNTGVTIALVSAHVAAPHRFRNYFPQSWLQHVRDAHCRTVLETRSQDGTLVTGKILAQALVAGFRHASLDVAAFPLDEDAIREKGDAPVLQLPADEASVESGQRISITGFRLLGESGSGTEAVVGTEVGGTVSEVWKSRAFVDTGDELTEMGMCGGPAVLADSPNICVGVLEGLVPLLEPEDKPEEEHKRLQGKSVLVSAKELRMFLCDVESELEKITVSQPNDGKTN